MPVGNDVCCNILWPAPTVVPTTGRSAGPLRMAALSGVASAVGMRSGRNEVKQIWK